MGSDKTDEATKYHKLVVKRLYECMQDNYLPFQESVIRQWEDLLPIEITRALAGSERFLAMKRAESKTIALAIRYCDSLAIAEKENFHLLEQALKILNRISGIRQIKIWDANGGYEKSYELHGSRMVELISDSVQQVESDYYEDSNNGWAD